MNIQDLINEGVELFKNKKFDEAIERLNQALDEIKDKESQIEEQNNIQFLLGCCYFEQARKSKGEIATKLFDQAVEHYRRQKELAKQLTDEQKSLKKQIYAQSLLGRCYFEQARKSRGEIATKLFDQAVKHYRQQLSLAKQLEGENGIQKQIDARSWLGRCYFEQARKSRGEIATKLFDQAVEHYRRQRELAKQLTNEQNRLQQQINTRSWQGRCYLEQAMKAEGESAVKLFDQAVEHYRRQLELATQLTNEQNRLQQQNNAQFFLGCCYFGQAIIQEKWESYFEWKKQKIQGDLFETKKGDLINAITTILAVLNIPPIELGAIPLSHYTSPSVCERLFGIVSDKTNDKNDDNDPADSNKVSPMRMGSYTYMNDPTEGEGLLELLNLQDLELDNKVDCPVYNAFFTCFSSRVNDLNQFRLYGKENGVEASGCCLVFNKRRRWLKDPDISASFRSLIDTSNESTEILAGVSDLVDANLPLYQVAYIAYYDEYIAKEKCIIWLPNEENPKFGIRLKPVGKNPDWHQFRIKKLEEALIELMEKSNNISDEDKKALEYIRYLFKDFAFRDEEEFRLLKIEQIGSDKIEYCEATKSIYLPYADVRNMVDEVILGTNYEKSGNHRKAEVFQHLMRKHYPNVKVSRSSLPINANPPIKKD